MTARHAACLTTPVNFTTLVSLVPLVNLPLPAAVLLAALLAGCAAPGAGIAPGSSVAAVTQQMGVPTGKYALPAGGRRRISSTASA